MLNNSQNKTLSFFSYRKILLLIIPLILVFIYIFLINIKDDNNSPEYKKLEKIVTSSIIKYDNKNASIKSKVQTYNSLNDATLIPYIDKSGVKLQKQVNILIKTKKSNNYGVVFEAFYIDKKYNAKKVFDLYDEKSSIYLDEEKNAIYFININGKNANDIKKIIFNKIDKK